VEIVSEELMKLLTSLSQQVGELRGEVKQVLKKLDSMEKKYNGYAEKTIRVEENIEELRKLLNDHLHEHEQEKGWKVQIKAAIFGGLAGSVVGFILSLVLYVFKLGSG
jgi:uncharacterized coiled-coil DUF342 family protein